MKRSKQLVIACSTALVGTRAVQGWAEGDTAQKRDQSRSQMQTQANQQAGQQAASGNKVSQKAGQPTNVMIVGTVTDARNVKLASTAGDQHRLLKVKPKDGEEIIVDLGVPDSSSPTNFSKGDRIVAVGKPARINDRPVVFAASVGEMQKVGRPSSDMKAPKDSTSQRTASTSSTASQGTKQATNDGGYDSVVYFFTTDNLAQDRYGPYDEDFAWETNDSAYDTWNDTADSWDQTEFAHYDMFGYDDAGEEGLWDW
jgi:hypothetical protein